MSNINKERTLRAFTVENTTETKANIDLLRMLRISLEDQKTLEDRLMPLTSEKKGESDLLTSWKLETNMLIGIIRPVLRKSLYMRLQNPKYSRPSPHATSAFQISILFFYATTSIHIADSRLTSIGSYVK